MSQDDEFFEVKFSPKALEDAKEMFKEEGIEGAPDELILKMKVGVCKFCGQKPKDRQRAACEPHWITAAGELVGDTICGDCLEKGL